MKILHENFIPKERDETPPGQLQFSQEKFIEVLEAESLCGFARCPNPRAGREKASKTMQFAKREVYD